MYRRMLVPMDGSKRAEAILPHVEELGERYGAEVVFLRVIESTPVYSGPEHFPVQAQQDELELLTEEAVAYLTGLKEQFEAKNIEARMRIDYGPVAPAIISAAESEAADLIAMASHGRSGLSQLFYGSVAVGVLHRADRPLLLVRARGRG